MTCYFARLNGHYRRMSMFHRRRPFVWRRCDTRRRGDRIGDEEIVEVHWIGLLFIWIVNGFPKLCDSARSRRRSRLLLLELPALTIKLAGFAAKRRGSCTRKRLVAYSCSLRLRFIAIIRHVRFSNRSWLGSRVLVLLYSFHI